MLTWDAAAWFSILTGAALKSTIVLGAAWLLAFALRGRSAAARHLVWTAATASMLALPVLSVALPDLRIPAAAKLFEGDAGVVFRVFAVGTTRASSIPAAPAAISNGPATASSWRPGDIKSWLIGVWAMGTVVSWIQMLLAYTALWRVRRGARLLADNRLSFALTRVLEIPHPVPVLETASGSMPMTFGLLRPAVFLPADSAEWSDERRRIVLLHELAHVKRGDAATHLMARTALGLNWFNPMAWIAWREFLKERERAADDLVLNAGARASEYASHLLEVAVSRQALPAVAAAAVAMARRSQLEGRLVAILDTRTNRHAARGMAPLLVAIISAIMVAPFAAVRAQNPASPAALPELDATIRVANSQKNHEILEHAAKLYQNLRQYEVAQTLLENALAIRGEVSGQQSAAYAAGLVKLGDLAVQRNQPTEALAFYRKAISSGDRREVASALVYLGISANSKRDFVQAVDYLQRAVNVDPGGPQAGRAFMWIANAREMQAASGVPTISAAEVEALYQRALATIDTMSLEAATTMELYSRFLRQNQREVEAAAMLSRAQDIRRQKLTLTAQTALPGQQPYTSAGAVRVGGGVTSPQVLSKTDPEYTEDARAAKYQGTVLLGIEVGTDGYAHNIQVLRGLGLGLDEKAVESVMRWQFKPGTRDGQAVAVKANIEVNFRLL